MERRLMFLYWGRKGSLGLFTRQLMQAAEAMPDFCATLSISRQNADFEAFAPFGEHLLPVDTQSHRLGLLTGIARMPALRRSIAARARNDGIEAAVTLMPHIWSGLAAPVFRRHDIPYATIVHDFTAHPGDVRTRLAMPLMSLDVKRADHVITLSRAVADRLVEAGTVPRSRIHALFHPDLDYGVAAAPRLPQAGQPLKLLFLGRIMAYKGLPLLVDALRRLQSDGVPVHLGVHGEGPIGKERAPLDELGAEVANHWHSDEEIAGLLSRYDAVVLSHTEASQSGVAAAALGAGLPVICTPVGGLPEQVEDGVTGIVAREATSAGLAEAIRRLALSPSLYCSLHAQIVARRPQRSMQTFLERLSAIVVQRNRPRDPAWAIGQAHGDS